MRAASWGNVTQLIFMPRLFPLNCYLVEENNGITLIDACMPFTAKKLHAAIKATGKPLTRILLTHAHEDHIGAVPYLKSVYPDAQIGISRRDAALLRGERGLQTYEPQSPIKGGVPKRAPFEPDFLFDDEERIGALTAIASARKLIELRPNVLAVGHGPALLQPSSAIEEAIKAAQAAAERRTAG